MLKQFVNIKDLGKAMKKMETGATIGIVCDNSIFWIIRTNKLHKRVKTKCLKPY